MARATNDLEALDALDAGPSGMPEGAVFTDVIRRVRSMCSEDGTGCWHWLGYAQDKATPSPLMSYKGRPTNVRRAMWIETRGRLERGRIVTKTCESYLCVAPAHVTAMSRSKFTAKLVADGVVQVVSKARIDAARAREGKLDMDKVRFIRASNESNAELGRQFNVSRYAVSMARRGLTWKETTPFTGLGAR